MEINPTTDVVVGEVLARRVLGKVKWFNVKHGYGFITRADNNEDVFVHYTMIKANTDAEIKSIGEEESVEFDVVQGHRGQEASEVTGPEGADVQGSVHAARHKERRDRRRARAQWRNTVYQGYGPCLPPFAPYQAPWDWDYCCPDYPPHMYTAPVMQSGVRGQRGRRSHPHYGGGRGYPPCPPPPFAPRHTPWDWDFHPDYPPSGGWFFF